MSALALQACPVLPLAHAWWLGTHRRLDLLDVPSFGPPRPAMPPLAERVTVQRRLHALPAAPRGELLALPDHAAGAVAGVATAPALSLLLHTLAAPHSWQPENPYAVHRTVPSPRCAFPCRVVVVEHAAAGVRAWGYEGDHHAVWPLHGPCDAFALLGGHRLAVVGIARHWALADRYGDFAPFNATLEAGMLQAQAQHLAAAFGWPAESLEARPAALRAAGRLCEHPLEAVAFGLRLSPPGDTGLGDGPGVDTAVAGLAPSPRLATTFDRLPPLAAQFAAIGPAGDSALPDPAPAAGVPAQGLLALMRSRSAGSDRGGLAPRLAPLAADALPRLLATWRALAARRAPLPGEECVQPLLLWLDAPAGAARLVDLQGHARPLPAGAEPAALLQQALPYAHIKHAMTGLKCHALWCADLALAEARHGAAALRRLHLAAGAQAQDYSLAATAFGLFARPLRMLREAVLEGGLALPGPLVYQVASGLNRRPNPRWQL